MPRIPFVASVLALLTLAALGCNVTIATANNLLAQNPLPAPTCTEDAAGNATVNGFGYSWAN